MRSFFPWTIPARGLLLALLVATLPLEKAAAADTEGATITVKRIQSLMIEAAKAPAGKRRARLAALIDRYLELDSLSQRVLGKAWQAASPADRQAFKSVMKDIMARELSRRVRKAEGFSVTGAKALGKNGVVVFSRQDQGEGAAKRLDWKMQPCSAGFCIVDLVGNGASLSLAQRDELAGRLKSAGGDVGALARDLRQDLDKHD